MDSADRFILSPTLLPSMQLHAMFLDKGSIPASASIDACSLLLKGVFTSYTYLLFITASTLSVPSDFVCPRPDVHGHANSPSRRRGCLCRLTTVDATWQAPVSPRPVGPGVRVRVYVCQDVVNPARRPVVKETEIARHAYAASRRIRRRSST
jgi:hypothetical protein